MTQNDLMAAIQPVVEALDALGARYYLRRWAMALGVGDLLDRALAQALDAAR